MNYLDVIYNKNNKNKPFSSYPELLSKYLYDRLNMRSNKFLLDIGSGIGEYVDSFNELGINSFGIDQDYDVKKYGIDIEKSIFPFSNKHFDYIFSKSLIEHLHNPDNMLKESRRVLKKKGKIIILVPNWYSQKDIFYEDPTHVRPYTKNSLKYLLEMYGFINVTSEIFYQYPLCWKIKLLKYLKLKLPVRLARFLTNLTGIKYFRWMNESMILAIGEK